VALRIGFDLDGVLADMESALARHAEQLFGPAAGLVGPRRVDESLTPIDRVAQGLERATPDLPCRRALTDRQRRRLWRRVRSTEGFWETLDETEPGVVSRLASLAADRHWEIIFLTRRPPTVGATAQVQSQRWLIAKGFDLPSVYVVTGSRGIIASALGLDIVVDDTPANCIDVASDSRARTIAVFRDPHATPPPTLSSMGIEVVRSAGEGLTRLAEIDASVNRRPGAMERLLRRLGLARTVNA
jgi:hypothetical protein